MPERTLLLVDGTAVAYRAFYAIKELSTADGTPTNALYGFIMMLRQLRSKWKPSHWAVVFDGGLPEERVEILETYKAQREPMPDPLAEQLDAIDEYLVLSPVPMVILEGEEADDVMATMARRSIDDGVRVLIATSDKDMYQLVESRVGIVPPSKTGIAMGPEEVQEKTGVEPGKIVEWLALVGDKVDNIPGVPGVGPKTAAKLLNEYNTLEDLWAHLQDIKSDKLRAALGEHRADVERNVKLVRLRTDLECAFDWDDLRVRPPDREQLVPFLERYELKSMADALRKEG